MMRRFLSLCAVAVTLAIPARAPAEIYALAIGIDSYDHLTSLDGAVNDARDVADALRSLGADVTLLLDREATRERIFAEWRRLAGRVGDGDLLIVSYAGHGSFEPEFWPGNEYDGRDETLLLSGFDRSGPAAAHRVRDDEIADLLALTPPAQTVFVGDACHSGTLSRNVSPALGYRYVEGGAITDDPLPPPPPKRLAHEGRGDLGLFLAAVDESQKVPEFLIDGEPRGALSYAFASALRGAADANGDDALTVGEIETHVRRQIRSVSRGLQRPQIASISSTDTVLLSLDGTPAALSTAPETGTPWETPFDALPELTLGVPDGFTVPPGLSAVPGDAPADLRLLPGKGVLISDAGDRVARLDGPGALGRAVDKARLAAFLMREARRWPLDIHFGQGDRLYRGGEGIRVQVSGRASPHLTLFNIGSDGTIAFLYPLSGDPTRARPGRFEIDLRIAPPFGADHIIAVETDAPPDALRAVLADHQGRADLRAFWAAFRRAAGEMEGEVRFAAFPFHTTG